MNIKDSAKTLKEKDIYSLLLFAIYKCTNDPKYSTLSELIYTMDKDSLLNFCSVFGGCTIKVPTLQELKVYANGLLVYDLVSKGKSFNAAFKETGLDSTQKKSVIEVYKTISEILAGYGE